MKQFCVLWGPGYRKRLQAADGKVKFSACRVLKGLFAGCVKCSCPRLYVQNGVLSGPQSFVYALGCQPKGSI